MEDRTVVPKQRELLQVIKNYPSAAVLLRFLDGAVCAAACASKSQTPRFLQ